MRRLFLLFAMLFLTGLGCGSKGGMFPSVDAPPEAAAAKKAPAAREDAGRNAEAAPLPRKIIYTAKIDLVVEDFEQARQQLVQLIKEQNAIVAKSEVTGTSGSRRSGHWEVRVPVDHFEEFLDALARLGELVKRSTDSDDITDRYYDLQSDIKNKQLAEERLRRYLEEKKGTSNLDDILKVESELNRVRGLIDSKQEQVKRWDRQTSLTTVDITLQERRDYVPPTSPDFSTSISRTWQGSKEALVNFGKGLVLVIVALTPWLPVIALPVAAVWWAVRRHRRAHPVLPASLTTDAAIVEPADE